LLTLPGALAARVVLGRLLHAAERAVVVPLFDAFDVFDLALAARQDRGGQNAQRANKGNALHSPIVSWFVAIGSWRPIFSPTQARHWLMGGNSPGMRRKRVKPRVSSSEEDEDGGRGLREHSAGSDGLAKGSMPRSPRFRAEREGGTDHRAAQGDGATPKRPRQQQQSAETEESPVIVLDSVTCRQPGHSSREPGRVPGTSRTRRQ
jgi:hypothetical protein